MGGCCTSPRDIVSKKATYIIKYDIDQNKNPDFTFVKRFARENTNDNGEKLSIKSAEIVVRQFKIYIIGVLYELVTENKLESFKTPYVVATFMPPPLV